MRNVSEAIAALNGRTRRKLDNNTYLETRDGGAIAVKLHETDVLTFKKDGGIVFNSGGWRTPTTKDRMNKYGPASIIQRNGEWFIDGALYQDGIEYKKGRIKGALPIAAAKKNAKALKDARAFCREYMDAFFDKKVPAPSGGDCWGCCFVSEDGKTAFGKDHIHQHIKERYFVPSLLVRACERFPISPAAKNAFYYAWNPECREETPDFIKGIARRQLETSLYRYVKTAFNLAA